MAACAREATMGAATDKEGAVRPELERRPVPQVLRDIRGVTCDVVLMGTPMRLDRLFESVDPMRHVTYALREIGTPTLADALAPVLSEPPVPAAASGPPAS